MLPELPATATATADGYDHGLAAGANGGAGGDIRAQDWSAVKLLEEYDPADLASVSRPHAYVADYVVQVDLSVSVSDEMQRYEERVRKRNLAENDPPMFFAPDKKTAKSSRSGGGGGGSSSGGGGWFEKLRDQLQRGEDIRWYVVVNGDEVRDWPDDPYPYYPIKTTTALPASYQQQQPQYDTESPTIVSRPPTTSTSAKQAQHHAQYMHQQQIFEGKDRGQMQVPLVPGIVGRGGGPAVPEKDLPVPRLRQKISYAGGGVGTEIRFKTPSKSGGEERRMFGRSHHKGSEAEGRSPT